MLKLHRLIVVAIPLIVSLAVVPVVGAHPLGNFTINHYAGLDVGRETITIDYVLDMAEIPAFQEIDGLDANRNGQPDGAEFAGYSAAKCKKIQNDLALSVSGQPVGLTLGASNVEFPTGAGGLLTLRLTCSFSATMSAASEAREISFTDNAYAERMGWREIVVSGDGVALGGNVSDYTTSLSKRLTEYPQDRINSPLDQRDITFTAQGGGLDTGETDVMADQPANASATTPMLQRSDAFTELITLETLNLPTVLFALGVAFVWGAAHGMTPGHGKTIVGAYLVGSRGTAKHALYLGLTTTITHTLGVFALGLVTLLASQFIFPEQVFPWISFLSGILVVGIGLNLCWTRLQEARQAKVRQAKPLTDGYHEHNGMAHSHEGGQEHSHLPSNGNGPVTWRSLLALGISGGLLPCPSALVVLLSAIALGRIGFGLVLVFVFSLGLAAVLTGIGLSLVYAGRLFKRIPSENWLIRLIPAASAAFIMVAGLGITAEALMQLGWIRL